MIDINGKKILFDCGLFQGGDRQKAQEKNRELLFDPTTVDYVIISHAHIDHLGRLPYLVKNGFKGKVFCTYGTKELAKLMLLDTAHIQAQDSKFKEEKTGELVEPLYGDLEVRETIDLMETYEYFQRFKITDNIWATFFDAGHVLGSAITVLEFIEDGEKRKLVFTGDLGRKYMPILNDPYQISEADYLIIESTYANRLHESFDIVEDRLVSIVNRVAKRKGKIIIPGFSLERTQALVYVLHQLYNEKKIPLLPIFVDSPLSTEISAVFEKNINYYDKETFRDFLTNKQSPFYFNEIKYLKKAEDSKILNSFKGSCIIISASGMCEAGRIKHHLKHHMPNPRNAILVVGFMAQGTRGRRIVDGDKNIKIFGEDIPLNAEVDILNAFSAHADKIELLDYVKNISNLKQIFLVHGEEQECTMFRDNLKNILKFAGKVDIADHGEEFELKKSQFYSLNPQRKKDYEEQIKNKKLKV